MSETKYRERNPVVSGMVRDHGWRLSYSGKMINRNHRKNRKAGEEGRL